MAIQRLLPNAASLLHTEFWNDAALSGRRITGDCGESALAAGLVCSSPPIEDPAQAVALMEDLTNQMISLGWAASLGQTTMAHLRDELIKRQGSYDTTSFISFQQPLPSTAFHNLLLSIAGIKPIVIEIATAGAGLHATNGSHAEAGVDYHFICIVGIANEGYVCYDGDNSAITTELPIYPWAAIEAATPCAVMVVDMGWTGDSPVALPTGWHDSGTALSNPTTSFTVTQGFRDYILQNTWEASDVPREASHGEADVEESNPSLGGGTAQAFTRSRLIWTSSDNKVRLQSLGVEYLFVRADRDKQKAAAANYQAQLATANSNLDKATAQVAEDTAQIGSLTQASAAKDSQISDLNTQVQQLQQQLAALQAAPPPPVAPVETDADRAAVAAVQAEAAADDAETIKQEKLDAAKKLLNL